MSIGCNCNGRVYSANESPRYAQVPVACQARCSTPARSTPADWGASRYIVRLTAQGAHMRCDSPFGRRGSPSNRSSG